MKCSSCTTELWGRPAVCPVCGAPTGLSRRSSRQTPPPWTPAAPAAPPPQHAPSQSQPFFNASDLLDPNVLDAVPQAPQETGAADIFSTGPLGDAIPESVPQGMINAADLFDPQVLADLTGSGDDGRSFQNRAEAPARDDYPSFAAEDEAGYQQDQGNYPPPPPRPSGKGPIAPPLFSLTALPATGPQPSMPPPPSPQQPFSPRDLTPQADAIDEPDEEDWSLQNGYRIVAGPPPLGVPASRPPAPTPASRPPLPGPPMPTPGMYSAAPYPMPVAPASKAGAQPGKGRPFFSTLGGFLSLLLVVVILGSAIVFGVERYFQLQALQPKPAQTTIASLPTVAPRAGYTIFPDQKLGISLQYANTWQKQADTDKSDSTYQGDLFYAGTNPGFNTGFEIGSSPQYASLSPLQIDNYVLANPFPLTNITSIQTFPTTASAIHINDQNWTAEDADVVNNGVNLRMTCLAIIHNGRGYVIFYFSRQEVFSSDYAQYFQPMLLSFRFLNG